jgi:hypothetical protein
MYLTVIFDATQKSLQVSPKDMPATPNHTGCHANCAVGSSASEKEPFPNAVWLPLDQRRLRHGLPAQEDLLHREVNTLIDIPGVRSWTLGAGRPLGNEYQCMKHPEHILAMAVATLWISLGRAEAEDAERQALNNVQHEMTTCAAFYGIMHQCLATRTPPEDAPMFENMTSATAHLLKQMLSTGRAIGMTVDGITSRLDTETATLQSLMNNNCGNASSLVPPYAARCKQVVEDPDSILTEHLSRR